MEERKYHEIKVVSAEGDTITATLNWDADAEDWCQVFRSIMYWLTFSPELIHECIPTEDDKCGPENPDGN